MADKIRWGILSTANIGRKALIPAIQQSTTGEVVAVASRSTEKAQAFADELGIPQAFGSYEAMINSGEVDAIYNPLPNSEHAKWSVACAEAGIPVLCEKPLASNASEAQEMVDAFAERGVLLAEAFMYRFHPQYDTIRQMIADGAIGELQVMNATFTFPMRNREGNIRLSSDLAGGGLMDVGCYCLSSMRLITGEEPDGGQAFARFGDASQVDEMLSGVLSFPSGVLGHFDSGFNAHLTQVLDIRGSEGRIQLPFAYTPPPDKPATIHYWDANGEHQEIHTEVANQYTLMVEDFDDAITNNRPFRFPVQDAVNNMIVIDSLLASARGQDAYWS